MAQRLLIAAIILTLIAYARPPEYDEAYSLFLTAGHARPAWPTGIFHPAETRFFYTGHASLWRIAENLRRGDVHPPLYFWLLEAWRYLAGPGWFAARLLSVAISLGSLWLLAIIARGLDIPILPAMALTLLNFAFAYTGIVARGFALAQFFNLLGFALAMPARKYRARHALAAGLALGAAGFTNYLAIFPALAMLGWHLIATRNHRRNGLLVAAFLAWIPADLWFFLAQRNSRAGQFTVFSLRHAITLLARDGGAALYGGLPLYAGPFATIATIALSLVMVMLACAIWHRAHPATALLGLCTAAMPAGLLALGFIFNNTPIEIRYLAFAMPYLALLLAASLPGWLLALQFCLQAAAVIGLALAPATAQPRSNAAAQALGQHLHNPLILVPYGNDGVGIPGPVIARLPDTALVALIRPGHWPDLSASPTIILLLIRADAASRATVQAAIRRLQADPCDTIIGQTSLTLTISNRCAHQ
ncbi:MAG: hypothetical protein POH28_12795 [Acidocella sp.]|nr:hypothetical protein [Acidocella sp.]